MFEYRHNHRYFAQTQRRLEPVAKEELEELGAVECVEAYCGVYFEADPPVLYKINYLARTIIRVLAPLIRFSCPSDLALYKEAYNIPWSDIFSIDQTFAIDANVSNSHMNHSKFAALRLKDAIVDYFRKKTGKRPDIDTENPDIRFNLNINENQAVISLDTSGESLHRRGYRVSPVLAPLQETLAAAIIRISGWNGEKKLVDPMCGSGTILAEALMKYCNIPSAHKRKTFGFFHLPGFDRKIWNHVKNECDKKIKECPEGLISGSDIDKTAVKAARQNLNEIPGGTGVKIHRADFRDLDEKGEHLIITNPPYGIRLRAQEGEEEKIQALYKELGDFLKQKCGGSTAFILCGDKELTKHIGLKISQRTPLYNGPIDSRLVKIDVYPRVIPMTL